MPKTPSTAAFDKALVAIAALACKSAKLSAAEKRELKALTVKGGKQGFNMTDRARCVWLVRKAGPEKIPDVKIPDRLKRLLGFRVEGDGPEATAIRERPLVDPLDRLETLGELRGKPLNDAQFTAQRDRILVDQDIAAYGLQGEVDPLARLTKVGKLQETGVLTDDQAAEVTERILNAY